MTCRTRRIAAVGAAATLAVLWGCASEPTVPTGTGAASSAERGALGNPPFYEVFGERYYVLGSSEDYLERGVASWYGEDFHRAPTSSGEPYDMHAMTAAHKTLPLPTWVEVTNLENGRRVVVRVNDRGPFVDDRIIDLSYAAALELDMVRDGTASVEVRALDAPPGEAPAPAPVRTAAADTRGGEAASGAEQLFIQVGAFSERANAARLVERLRGSGFDNVFVVSNLDDALHRVRVGPFRDVSEYDRAHDGLRRSGVREPRLVVGP